MTDKNATQIMVRITLATALLLPALHGGARAQPTIACNVQNMQFGKLVNCVAGGNITITPGGLVQTDGCVQALGTPQEAICKISTLTPQTQAVKVEATIASVKMTGAGNIFLDNFNIDTKSGGSAVTYPALSFTKTQKTIGIGARLTLSPSQNAGSYAGTVNISVTFQ